MQLFKHYLNHCMPSGLFSSELQPTLVEEKDYDENYDYDKYPIIRIFGHGWDASKDDEDLMNNSWKRVNAIDLDLAWVYGLPERTPYIEFEDDDVSDNVVDYEENMVPNMLISISDFKYMPKYTPFRFGIWEVTNTTEINITHRWLQENTSIFTLRDIVRFLNNIYPEGYHLELHMGRNPVHDFDENKIPEHVQYSEEAEQYLEYADNTDTETDKSTNSVMDMESLLTQIKKTRRRDSSISSQNSSYLEC